MKTALVERWERRLKEYEDMREQMRLSRGGGGTGTVADVARIMSFVDVFANSRKAWA
jgi:hypothetical protein